MANAAACCGGNLSAPAMISGDEKAQVSVMGAQSEIRADAQPDGKWRRRDETEIQRLWRIEAAHILNDRWQTGLSVPILERTRSERTSSGLGDVAVNTGYEFLPDWDYNPWRPKGIGFIQLTVPSGRSIYESNEIDQMDARGRGYWSLGGGAVLTKMWGAWDGLCILELHRSFSRSESVNGEGYRLSPGWGGAGTLGGGFHFKDIRIGGSLQSMYEDPVGTSGAVKSNGSAQRVVTAVASLTYTPVDQWSASLNYADQTLFGKPVNTTLAQGVQFQIQRRFDR